MEREQLNSLWHFTDITSRKNGKKHEIHCKHESMFKFWYIYLDLYQKLSDWVTAEAYNHMTRFPTNINEWRKIQYCPRSEHAVNSTMSA